MDKLRSNRRAAKGLGCHGEGSIGRAGRGSKCEMGSKSVAERIICSA